MAAIPKLEMKIAVVDSDDIEREIRECRKEVRELRTFVLWAVWIAIGGLLAISAARFIA